MALCTGIRSSSSESDAHDEELELEILPSPVGLVYPQGTQ